VFGVRYMVAFSTTWLLFDVFARHEPIQGAIIEAAGLAAFGFVVAVLGHLVLYRQR